jgi:hypothetical protein
MTTEQRQLLAVVLIAAGLALIFTGVILAPVVNYVSFWSHVFNGGSWSGVTQGLQQAYPPRDPQGG